MSQFIEMFGDPYTGWKYPTERLGEVYNIGTGGTPDRKVYGYYEGQIPWVKSTEVSYCELYDTEEHISEQAIKDSNCSLYPSGTILLAMYGQGTTRGRVAQLRTDAAVNQAIAAIQVQDETESLFLYSMLKVCYDYVRNLAVGGNQHNLNLKLVSSIPLIVPPKELQLKFVSIAKQADKSGFDGRKSQFIEMTGDPRINPKGWPVKTLPELATYSIGLTYKPENLSEDGTIVLRSGNIQNSKIDLADIVRVNCPIKESIYVQKNDILMCSRNGSAALVGKVAMIKDIPEPMTYGAFMTVIRSDYSDYLYLYFQSNDFREQVSKGKSSTMNQITQNMLDKISLPLPDDETRKKLSIILHQADKSGSVLQYMIAC